MEKCTRHPERETRFQCLKHGTWMCEECLACRDPEIYCKNRSACPIWFIEKRRKRLMREEVERLLSITGKLKTQTSANLNDAEKLGESILAKAFSQNEEMRWTLNPNQP